MIDSNVAIDLIARKLPTAGAKWVDDLILTDQACTSVINQIELLGFDEKEEEHLILSELLDVMLILPLTDGIAARTIQLGKQRKIKLPDAIIAATALVHNLTLISRNRKDFARIDGLQMVDPYSL